MSGAYAKNVPRVQRYLLDSKTFARFSLESNPGSKNVGTWGVVSAVSSKGGNFRFQPPWLASSRWRVFFLIARSRSDTSCEFC